MLSSRIKSCIRDIPDFPKPGVLFKDITPILADQVLCGEIVKAFARAFSHDKPDAVACMEARGFWFGSLLAYELKVPFVPIRKEGKLPGALVSCTYDLEYGSACIEMHADAIRKGWKVLIHDDVLATGGTALAASELIALLEGQILGYAFLLDLTFLNGRDRLKKYTSNIVSLAEY